MEEVHRTMEIELGNTVNSMKKISFNFETLFTIV